MYKFKVKILNINPKKDLVLQETIIGIPVYLKLTDFFPQNMSDYRQQV